MFASFRAAFLLLSLGTLVLSGCSGVYFNTTFNAEKAHDKALTMRAERIRLNPDDTVQVTSDERLLLQRAVRKSSKVLELWPDHPEYAPRAVYRIAECQYLMEDYGSAAVKYDEFLRYFPQHEQVPMAKVRLAQAYFHDGKTLAARDALNEAVAGDSLTGAPRRESLLLSAQMLIAERTSDQTGDARADAAAGLAVYEQLLREQAFVTPEARNEVRWRAAQLAWELKEWEKARTYALAANEAIPPMRIQFRNRRIGVLALYELGHVDEGLTEVRTMQGQRPYRPFRAELKLLEARGVHRQGDWPAARALYQASVRLGPRLASAAESWYRIGAHFLDVENREDSARAYFDSAAAAGRAFEYGLRAADFGSALKRLAELRLMDSAATADRHEAARAAEDSARVAHRAATETPENAESVAADSAAERLSGLTESTASAEPGDSTAAAERARAEADSLARARIAELAERYPDVPADIREARAMQDSLDRVKSIRAESKQTENKRAESGRDTTKPKIVIPKPPSVQYAPFMIAELFHFRLFKPDSARRFLERIVADTAQGGEDSVYTRRALYALAWLEAEGFTAPDGTVLSPPDPARGQELYRAVIARYPATEWAKAAARNLGLPVVIQTPDDSARMLLVEAERRRFAGEGLARVKPAYEAVVARYPASPAAARAQFAIAFLVGEAAAQGELGPPGQAIVDTVKAEYEQVRELFAGTPQAAAAQRHLAILNRRFSDEPRPDEQSGQGRGEEQYEETPAVRPADSLEDASEQDLY